LTLRDERNAKAKINNHRRIATQEISPRLNSVESSQQSRERIYMELSERFLLEIVEEKRVERFLDRPSHQMISDKNCQRN